MRNTAIVLKHAKHHQSHSCRSHGLDGAGGLPARPQDNPSPRAVLHDQHMAFCNGVTALVDKGGASDIIYPDFTKTFHMVHHNIPQPWSSSHSPAGSLGFGEHQWKQQQQREACE